MLCNFYCFTVQQKKQKLKLQLLHTFHSFFTNSTRTEETDLHKTSYFNGNHIMVINTE